MKIPLNDTNINNPLNNTNIKLINTKNFLVLVGLILVSIGGLPALSQATGASLYLSPGQGTFYVGDTFNISIFANTGDNNINAVETNLKFDPQKLQVVNPTAGESFITIWIAQPSYSNTEGTIAFQGGIPHPGINTPNGLISTITFRARSPGTTIVSLVSSSKILLDDGKGTNILTSLSDGKYTFSISPPAGPKIYSPTHPDQNKWYKDNNPTLFWEKEENISGFSWSLDNDPKGAPDNEIDGVQDYASYQNLDSGLWYFHLKAKRGELWGGVSHYLLLIDSSPPASFTPDIKPAGRSVGKQRFVSFLTTDLHSGIDHYEVKIIDIKSSSEKETFFIEAGNPWYTPELKPGFYKIIIRAYDRAGNYIDGSQEIEVISPFFSSIAREGFIIRGVFLPWWFAALILTIFIILLIIFYLWRRKHRDLSDELEKHIIKTQNQLRKEREMQEKQIKEQIEVKEALEKGLKKVINEKDEYDS